MSHELFQVGEILDSMPIMALLLDKDGQIIYANQTWKDATRDAHSLLNNSDLMDNIDQIYVKDSFERLQHTKETVRFIIGMHLYPLQKNVTSVLASLKCLKDMFMATFMPLASPQEHPEAENVKDWWRLIADQVPVMFWAANSSGRNLFYSKAFYSFVGDDLQNVDDVILWRLILHPDDNRKLLEAWTKSLTTLQPFNIQYRLWDRKTSKYKYFKSYAHHLNDSPFGISWIGVTQDIDEYVEALEKATVMQDRFNFITENVNVIFFTLDENGVLDYESGLGLEFVPNQYKFKMGENLIGRVMDTDKERFERIIKTGVPETFDSNFGTRSYTNIWMPRQRPPQQMKKGIIALAIDVTEAAQHERERQELAMRESVALASNRVKTQFLTNMSHELRTPLTAIMGMTELIQEFIKSNSGKCDLQEIQKLTDVIIDNVRYLTALVENVIDVAIIEQGTLDIKYDEFSPSELADDVMHFFRHEASERSLSLEMQIESNLPKCVYGDRLRTRQILMHLISNAVKFTDEGGITIQLRLGGTPSLVKQDVEFTISDTGIGIKDDILKRLFLPFVQGDESMTRRHGGTGLGLYMTKLLIDALSGKINISSKESVGTTVSVILPYKFCPSWAAPRSSNKLYKKRKLSGLRVLLAEDNKITQTIVRRFMDKHGIILRIANNGLEAVDWVLQGNAVDLVLMDLSMPVMDGFTAFEKIHNSKPHIPIIAVTANALPEDVKRTTEMGFKAHVKKPFTENELIECIQKQFIEVKD